VNHRIADPNPEDFHVEESSALEVLVKLWIPRNETKISQEKGKLSRFEPKKRFR
jgi:hypothetical protein